MQEKILKLAQKAKLSSRKLAALSSGVKDRALKKMAELLREKSAYLIKENGKDLEYARSKGLSSALIDRLTLNEQRIKEMVKVIKDVISLPDPVGEIIRMWRRPNGLQIGKLRTSLGVIAIIYESRPNVTVDVVSLCLKSGNSVILRGGSEAINSNIALSHLLSEAALSSGIPEGSIQLIDFTQREAISELLKLDAYIDLVIPRGGHSLIKSVVENSLIPVLRHDRGICHVFVDACVELKMAEEIAYNAKVQRPSVCNAMETLLVDQRIAKDFLPLIFKRYREAGVEMRGCPETKKILPEIKEAKEQDWDTEYLDLIVSIKIVSGIEEAIQHINTYGTGLSEAIVTANYPHSQKFLQEVDAASICVNASTRFTDGNQFGLGTEMGISTQKLHARGPVGLEELTSYKYIILGNGQVRQ